MPLYKARVASYASHSFEWVEVKIPTRTGMIRLRTQYLVVAAMCIAVGAMMMLTSLFAPGGEIPWIGLVTGPLSLGVGAWVLYVGLRVPSKVGFGGEAIAVRWGGHEERYPRPEVETVRVVEARSSFTTTLELNLRGRRRAVIGSLPAPLAIRVLEWANRPATMGQVRVIAGAAAHSPWAVTGMGDGSHSEDLTHPYMRLPEVSMPPAVWSTATDSSVRASAVRGDHATAVMVALLAMALAWVFGGGAILAVGAAPVAGGGAALALARASRADRAGEVGYSQLILPKGFEGPWRIERIVRQAASKWGLRIVKEWTYQGAKVWRLEGGLDVSCNPASPLGAGRVSVNSRGRACLARHQEMKGLILADVVNGRAGNRKWGR